MHQGYTLNDDKARFSNKVVMHSLYPEKTQAEPRFWWVKLVGVKMGPNGL